MKRREFFFLLLSLLGVNSCNHSKPKKYKYSQSLKKKLKEISDSVDIELQDLFILDSLHSEKSHKNKIFNSLIDKKVIVDKDSLNCERIKELADKENTVVINSFPYTQTEFEIIYLAKSIK